MNSRVLAVLALGLAWPAQAEAPLPSTVASFETAIGIHFTASNGHTLYVYDADVEPSRSTCVAACARAWPPLAADDAAQPTDAWSIFRRDDGTRQWALRGKPVYTFVQDPQPGATLGDGIQNVWHIAVALKPRPPGVRYRGTVRGRVIADPAGMTLYDRPSGDCTKTCLNTWTPFTAPTAAVALGDWSIITRADDQSRQWAWQGRPLYTYRGDVRPGDGRGDGIDKVWRPVIIQPAFSTPPWVTVTPSDYGPIFADSAGLTLYTTGELAKSISEGMCAEACIEKNWIPIIAGPNDKPVGNWSFMPLADGTKQWAYRAQPLYRFMHDKKPGEILGDKFALGGGSQAGGWHVLPQMTLKEENL